MRELIVEVSPTLERVGLYQNGKLEDLAVEPNDRRSLVGRIYKGRVIKVMPALDAAFVDIGLEKPGYLSLKDMLPPGARKDQTIKEHIRGGKELLVQVMKDPRETKGAQLTTRLTLPGRWMVLTIEEPGIRCSRKIEDPVIKNRLKQWVEPLLSPSVGVLFRTESAEADKETLLSELERLLALWNRIEPYRVLGSAPLLVYRESSLGIRFFRQLKDKELQQVLSNDEGILQEFRQYFSQTSMQPPVCQYKEALEIGRDLTPFLSAYVPLNEGGHLWIESTHAMTVIDVNSGGLSGVDPQELFLRTNRNAALEIARQLRLRNIGGVILIDFIDMGSQSHRNAVQQELSNAMAGDRAPVEILGFTKLGLLEMTRKKTTPPLAEILQEECPLCAGTGKIDGDALLLEKLEQEIQRLKAHTLETALALEMGESLYQRLQSGALGGHQALESRYGLRITVTQIAKLVGYRIVK